MEKTKSSIWLNKLFYSFTKDSDIELYFEQKEKLSQKNDTLNLSIHPIRFADDIFFNFETNSEVIKQKLKKYELDYNVFYHYADLIKATYIQSVKKNNISKNSLLIIGQTQKDKVIFNGKKYLNLLDYIKELKNLSVKYDNLYFKPHPYAKNNKFIYNSLKKEFKNIQIIHDNIYHLLSNENIKHIVALNSSVLYEAKYFNKETTFLYKQYFDFQNNDIAIYGNYFDSSFWSNILDIPDTSISLPHQPSRLRKAINDFWGYNEISEEIILKDILKSKLKNLLSRIL